jgi:hypothetical protein
VRIFARLIAHLSSLDDGIKISREGSFNNQTGGSLCAAKISFPFLSNEVHEQTERILTARAEDVPMVLVILDLLPVL